MNLTAKDSWSGTPGYMAPEVVLGAADTDHRVDLYALGCVAYWLLTGKMVFEGESAMQVMIQHVQAEPKRRRADGAPIPRRSRSWSWSVWRRIRAGGRRARRSWASGWARFR